MATIKPREIHGKWHSGFYLDEHTIKSVFLGYDSFGHTIFNTQRTELGELLYRLKYNKDISVINVMINTLSEFIKNTGWRIDLIVPVPPSNQNRKIQPVLILSEKLAEKLDINICKNCVYKIKNTPQLKDIYEYNERMNILKGAFEINQAIVEKKNILLFDDLYRSGATVNCITKELIEKGKVNNVYLIVLTRTKKKR
ncbi:ComF family protein [Candidatus Sumerlaeota bacterium]|nr:ComF family protein [Candidatus Sumerlaeota bacterium]